MSLLTRITLLATLWALALSALPAAAQTVDQPIQISARHSGQCMDLQYTATADLTPVVQHSCYGGSTQMWTVQASGAYFWVVSKASGKCLNITDAATGNGAQAVLWPCDNGLSSQFSLVSVGSGYHQIIARHSGRCMAVGGSSNQSGAGVIQWDCVAGLTDQHWRIPAPAAAQVPTISTQINARHSGQCMDLQNAATADMTPIVQAPCYGGNSQTWTVQASGAYYWVVSKASGKCLNITGAATGNGAQAVLWPCDNGLSSQFSLVSVGSGYYQIVARHSGRCMAIGASSNQTGAGMLQWDCVAGLADQHWLIANPALHGTRSQVIGLSLVPVAAANMPNGKVVMWSAYDRMTFGGDSGQTYTAIFDPATNAATETLVSNTQHDMFCPGTTLLADGRLLVSGGSSSAKTSIYNPFQNIWSGSGAMNIPRAYQANTLLSDGKVFTLGGSWSGGEGSKDGERWDPATGAWVRLGAAPAAPMLTADPQGLFRADNHAWLVAAADGRVLHAGPSKQMNWYGSTGNGSTGTAGNRGDDADSMNGNAVLHDVGTILKIGGAPAYAYSDASNSAYLIDINNGVNVRKLWPMAYPRSFHNSVVLPNGKVMVVGGQSRSAPFEDTGAILTTELWDPLTESFSPAVPLSTPRTYHSIALLLPDGRVLAGGGGLCGDCDTNHPNVEIFSPPYLYQTNGSLAPRPAITAAPATTSAGATITVATNTVVSSFALVRMAAVTHTVNNDQRRIPLAAVSVGAKRYSLKIPASRGVALPGYYMLFALNGAGVPSVSVPLQVL